MVFSCSQSLVENLVTFFSHYSAFAKIAATCTLCIAIMNTWKKPTEQRYAANWRAGYKYKQIELLKLIKDQVSFHFRNKTCLIFCVHSFQVCTQTNKRKVHSITSHVTTKYFYYTGIIHSYVEYMYSRCIVYMCMLYKKRSLKFLLCQPPRFAKDCSRGNLEENSRTEIFSKRQLQQIKNKFEFPAL